MGNPDPLPAGDAAFLRALQAARAGLAPYDAQGRLRTDMTAEERAYAEACARQPGSE